MKQVSLCTVVFVCSLMLNAFLVGLMLSNHCQPPQSGMHKRIDHMQEAIKNLDPAYRDKVQALLDQSHMKMGDHMKSMDSNMDKITAVLTAPKFDAAKLKAVHEDIAKSDNGMKDNMLTTVTGIAKILPDAERIKFFKDSAPDHHDHGPGGEHGGPPDDHGEMGDRPPPPDDDK